MKLSVITICLNEFEIERTCKSIFEQTFNDFEWIIIDGLSNIQTINKIKKYISKIDLFISEKDSGIYDAMNKGRRSTYIQSAMLLSSGTLLA